MPIQGHTTTINGTEYSIRTLGGLKGFEVASKLMGLMGGPVGAVGAALAVEGSEASALARVLPQVAQAMADATFREIVFEVLDGARSGKLLLVDGDKKGGFELHFAENYGDLPQLVWFALEKNFASFFAGNRGLGSLIERAKVAGAAALSRQQTSPGKSPGSSPEEQPPSGTASSTTT